MIGVIDVQVQAQAPGMPLPEFQAFAGSPSSVRVRNVPRRVGQWDITSVTAVAVYPDGSSRTADCVLAGGVWVGTVSGCAVSGRTENGFTVYASGTDENGNAVSNYVLGKGDVVIYEADGEIKPNEPFSYVRLLSAESATPHDGDLYPLSGEYAIYQNGAAHKIADTSLTPVYSPTPTFGDWVCDPAKYAGEDIIVEWNTTLNGWTPGTVNYGVFGSAIGDLSSQSLTWKDGSSAMISLSATRARTDVIGYVLGGQTAKPLQPFGDYATRAQVSAIVEAYLSAQNGGQD